MRFGGPFPFAGPLAEPDIMVRTARAVEAMGFDHIWIADHILFPKTMTTPYPFTADGKFSIDTTTPMYELFTVAAFVAAHTSRLILNSNVLLLPLRQPVVVARQIASLDALSNGRFRMAIGVGWMEDEYEAVDVPFHRRGKIMDAAIGAIRALFEERAFKSEWFNFEESHFYPKPKQDPFPFWIGGDSEAAMMRAARLGEGWQPVGPARENIWYKGMRSRADWLRERMPRLHEERARLGRDHLPFGLSNTIGLLSTATGEVKMSDRKEQLLEDVHLLAEAGCTHLKVIYNEQNSHGPIEKILDEAQWFAEEIMAPCRDL